MEPWMVAFGGIAAAWLLREVVPAYLRSARGDDVATKSDILYMEQRVTGLEATITKLDRTLGQVRDWVLYQQAGTDAKRALGMVKLVDTPKRE